MFAVSLLCCSSSGGRWLSLSLVPGTPMPLQTPSSNCPLQGFMTPEQGQGPLEGKKGAFLSAQPGCQILRTPLRRTALCIDQHNTAVHPRGY